MPKSKLAEIISNKADSDYINNVVINISHEMVIQKLTVKEISKKTGISESTMRLRLNNPGTLRQSEIVEIAKVLKMSPFKLVSQRLEYVIE